MVLGSNHEDKVPLSKTVNPIGPTTTFAPSILCIARRPAHVQRPVLHEQRSAREENERTRFRVDGLRGSLDASLLTVPNGGMNPSFLTASILYLGN